jgi:hypothetical protein
MCAGSEAKVALHNFHLNNCVGFATALNIICLAEVDCRQLI